MVEQDHAYPLLLEHINQLLNIVPKRVNFEQVFLVTIASLSDAEINYLVLMIVLK